MKVQILGGATTQFGELWDRSPRDLVREASFEALKQARLDLSSVEAIYVGNMLSGLLGGQEHLGAFYTTALGTTAPSFKIEGACASGGLAVHNGILGIISGQYRVVLVIGVEKMTDFKPEEVTSGLMGAGSDEERQAGATFPGLYALMARAHMEEFGTTEKDLAAVAVKNHYHASFNTKAHFINHITIEQVLHSSKIADPLKLLDCSPVSDGAAAVILGDTRYAKRDTREKKVFIEASSVATDSLSLSGRKTLTSLPAAKTAVEQAYKASGAGPRDIDIAEVHDCFTIAEIMAMEDLGFFGKGKAAKAIVSGVTRLGGEGPIVNTSGGLKACGHPVGATGVKQIVEVFEQLSGRAGKRQVRGAQIGLTHNVGGSGATAVVHILKSQI